MLYHIQSSNLNFTKISPLFTLRIQAIYIASNEVSENRVKCNKYKISPD